MLENQDELTVIPNKGANFYFGATQKTLDFFQEVCQKPLNSLPMSPWRLDKIFGERTLPSLIVDMASQPPKTLFISNSRKAAHLSY